MGTRLQRVGPSFALRVGRVGPLLGPMLGQVGTSQVGSIVETYRLGQVGLEIRGYNNYI